MTKGFDGSVESGLDGKPPLAEMQRHVKRILSDLPWHLVLPLALAGGGTYTVGNYRQRGGSEDHGCERTARAPSAPEEAIPGTSRNCAHAGPGRGDARTGRGRLPLAF